uniref:Uncharacterized protein n=1 Tax=Cannabis sativa TaxID=3483 RepID=A0A803P404_CANSA
MRGFVEPGICEIPGHLASMANNGNQDPFQPQAPAANLGHEATLPNNNLRLDRTNYTLWHSLVLAAAQAYDLDNYILGNNP